MKYLLAGEGDFVGVIFKDFSYFSDAVAELHNHKKRVY